LKSIVTLARSSGLRQAGVSAIKAHGTLSVNGLTIRVFPISLQCYALGIRLLDETAVIHGYEG
jgi:hypothetical protein